MPMVLPPMYFDVPAIVQPAAQSPGVHASARSVTSLPSSARPPALSARPDGFSSVPNVVPPPHPAPQPSGSSELPDATTSQQTPKLAR